MAMSIQGGSDSRLGSSVSIVMVSYHTGPALTTAIRAGLDQSPVEQLVLVNNGNPPEVGEMLREWAAREPRLVLEQGQGNVGFAAGCNLGARRATGDLLLLLNPDCVLPAGAVSALAAEGLRQPRPWLLGPRLLNPDGSEQAGDRRRVLTPWLALVEALGLYRLPGVRRFNLHQEPLPAQTLPVPVISGACMLLPRQDYWDVGGMDEAFFLHVEDIDFCVRFGANGGGVYFCPAVRLPHAKGSSDAPALAVEWHKTRGFLHYFRKHFSHSSVPGVILLTNGAILLRYLLMALANLVARPFSQLRARQGGQRG